MESIAPPPLAIGDTLLSGVIASPGIALGPALLVKKQPLLINHQPIAAASIPQERSRFSQARAQSIQQLRAIEEKAHQRFGEKEAAIFEAHRLLLEDELFEAEIMDYIQQHQAALPAAIEAVIEQQAVTLEQLTDDYLKARAADIRDIGQRLLSNVLCVAQVDLQALLKPVILVAETLTPSETAQLDVEKVLGFITVMGSSTSHTAIMARALGIPALVGVQQALRLIHNDDLVLLEARNNQVIIHPSTETIEAFKVCQQREQQQQHLLAALTDYPSVTLEGHQVTLSANISHFNELSAAQQQGAEGVGLYRTEFLFMGRESLPSEEEQFQAYQAVAQQLRPGETAVIRTVDIGGDKPVPYLDLPTESNPFLGCRGIRLYQYHPELLPIQLRAILRASAFGKLSILFPMISLVEEVHALQEQLARLKQQLHAEKQPFDPQISVGIMVETPAAALMASYLAKMVDFLSIGTNDLTQYTLAVDRGNPLTASLYNPLSPAVLQLIQQIIDAAHQFGKSVCVCGELAGDTQATLLLLGLGLDKFSVSARAIPRIKKIVRSVHFAAAQQLAQQALLQPMSGDIRRLTMQLMQKIALSDSAVLQ
jgi:phosphoenolpyruvate-protein phosphotransferase (PTS system enzyme I)